MILFMVYATVFAALLALAAARAEEALADRGIPTRWVWASALAGSLGAGAWSLLRPAPQAAVSAPSWTGLPVAYIADLQTAVASQSTFLQQADSVALWVWVGASLALALALAGGLLRLARKARAWAPARVAGGTVLLSEDFGPAVMGVRSPRVVLPRWALGLEPERLRLVVLHEEEHQRAGDAGLLLAASVAVILAPWNAALWWQLHRLRGAVEMDCDARVLRRGAPAALYGRLLLEMGIQEPGPLPVAALSRSPSLLERRLTMIVRGDKRGSVGKAAGGMILAAVLVAVACETPMPTAVRPTEAVSEGDVSVMVPMGEQVAQGVLVEVTEAGAAPLYMVDGKRVENISGIPEEDIVRVEVVKGSASEAVFGPDARSGVVHVLTKNAPAGMLQRVKEEMQEQRFGSPAENQMAGEVAVGVLQRMDEARVYVDGVLFAGKLEELDKSRIASVDVVKGKPGEPSSIYIKLKR